jgi:ribosomal protein L11 methyltransferase
LAEYLELDFTLVRQGEPAYELLLARLSQYGFTGFLEEEGKILAYIPAEFFNEADFKDFLKKQELNKLILTLEPRLLPDKNWNEAWEREYNPVQVGPKCMVRAPFHAEPDDIEFDLVISPKMAFGTAHHETTRGMMQMMLDFDMEEKSVLDLGCGTGILAILAEKMGGNDIYALDNDPWACNNALENIAINDCSNIKVVQAELPFLTHQTFDFILANINLNPLLGWMDQFPARLRPRGILMLSGFYLDDLQHIDHAAKRNGLKFVVKEVMNNWTVAVYRKAI